LQQPASAGHPERGAVGHQVLDLAHEHPCHVAGIGLGAAGDVLDDAFQRSTDAVRLILLGPLVAEVQHRLLLSRLPEHLTIQQRAVEVEQQRLRSR